MDAIDYEPSNIDVLFDQRVHLVISKSFIFVVHYFQSCTWKYSLSSLFAADERKLQPDDQSETVGTIQCRQGYHDWSSPQS